MNNIQKRARARKKKVHIINMLVLIVTLTIIFICIFQIISVFKDSNDSGQILGKEIGNEGSADDSEEKTVVVVDAGHGGKDEGTAYGSIKEKDINLTIAEYVKAELERRGMEVIMTRSDDTFLQLGERTAIANEADADFFLSIHLDSYFQDSSINGITAYYTDSKISGDKYAQIFTNAIKSEGYTVRDAVKSDLYVLNHTKMPGVLIEAGFISNESDRYNLTNDEYIADLAGTLADCVEAILNGDSTTADVSQESSGGGNSEELIDFDAEFPYEIKVNRVQNFVIVYGIDYNGSYSVPYKIFVCSTGAEGHETPLGTFSISDKYEWRLMVDGSYAQYATRIYNGIMFHSVPYFSQSKDNLETEEFNKLGSAASLGCIRLTVEDIKWIYDNCPEGTTVTIYDDEDEAMPLAVPDTIKIPIDSPYAGWDPTDPDEDNPWK